MLKFIRSKLSKKLVCAIQARYNSTRLPGKALLPYRGSTILMNCYKTAKQTLEKYGVDVVVCCPENDTKIINYCELNKIPCVESVGISENDLVGRYLRVLNIYKCSHVMRITSDCPEISESIIDNMYSVYIDKKRYVDFISNAFPFRTYCDGDDVEIFSKKAIEKIVDVSKTQNKKDYYLEHPGLLLYHYHAGRVNTKELSKLNLFRIDRNYDQSHIKTSIDTPEEYEKAIKQI